MHIAGFKESAKYHSIRKVLGAELKFSSIRFLDPGNPKSAKKTFFHPDILKEIDKRFHD